MDAVDAIMTSTLVTRLISAAIKGHPGGGVGERAQRDDQDDEGRDKDDGATASGGIPDIRQDRCSCADSQPSWVRSDQEPLH